MSDPFIAQITLFGGNFAPRGWAFCNGQLLSISSNSALFSILGTTFGGDGRTTFGLPDLRGRVSVHDGGSAGPGLSRRRLGEKGGTEDVTLNTTQLPSHAHAHAQEARSDAANNQSPVGNVPAVEAGGVTATYSDQAPNAAMRAGSSGTTGDNGSHNNIQPYQGVNYIIALVGVFPSRN